MNKHQWNWNQNINTFMGRKWLWKCNVQNARHFVLWTMGQICQCTSIENKTDVERRQTLGHPRSINPNMINHVPQQSPLIFWVIYVVCTRSNKNFVFVSSPMSRFKKLSKVRCQQPLLCWLGSVAFPILPIHIANLSRLSKCTLSIILIPKPLKLSNSQISYPIWQMSILMFAWRVSDNQV